jgi:hypothetical protein
MLKTGNYMIDFKTFLSKWLIEYGPIIRTKDFQYNWANINMLDNVYYGFMALHHDSKAYGFLDNNCYLRPIENGEKFLIWTRGTNKIELYDSSRLEKLTNFVSILSNFQSNKIKYYFNSQPIGVLIFDIDGSKTDYLIDFPRSFCDIDDFYVITFLPDLYSSKENSFHNTAILELQPKKGKIKVYPQDWFNFNSKIDFGYQWIANVEENTLTNEVMLNCMRIGIVTLDYTKRQLKN